MDKYDPSKKIGLMVDEWGYWFVVEPGTNPGFLFQQNSLRDALVAGTNLNIFNNHSDRVRMTCITQMINVLQALILTSGKEMVLTPTYYIYQMYADHQNASLLKTNVRAERYFFNEKSLNSLNVSASKDLQGLIPVTICNINAEKNLPLELIVNGIDKLSHTHARLLATLKINDYNNFGKKPLVVPVDFRSFKVSGNHINLIMPARSVLEIEFSAAF